MPESTEESNAARNAARLEVIGLLIRHARETAGRTCKECATFIGVTSALMRKYEEGSREPSLVELEMLAHYLRVPIQALLDPDASTGLVAPRTSFSMAEVGKLRAHIIGARLKQARLKSSETVQQVANAVGLKVSQLNAYELGKRPIPITSLERLLSCLDIPLESLLDLGIGPLGEAQLHHKQHGLLDALPDDVRAFVTDPDSLPYLRAAMHLHSLPHDEVHDMGHALITISELHELQGHPELSHFRM